MIDHDGTSLASFKDLIPWSFGRSLPLPCRRSKLLKSLDRSQAVVRWRDSTYRAVLHHIQTYADRRALGIAVA